MSKNRVSGVLARAFAAEGTDVLVTLMGVSIDDLVPESRRAESTAIGGTSRFRAYTIEIKFAVPAEAGTHSSTASWLDRWVPACAGTAVSFGWLKTR